MTTRSSISVKPRFFIMINLFLLLKICTESINSIKSTAPSHVPWKVALSPATNLGPSGVKLRVLFGTPRSALWEIVPDTACRVRPLFLFRFYHFPVMILFTAQLHMPWTVKWKTMFNYTAKLSFINWQKWINTFKNIKKNQYTIRNRPARSGRGGFMNARNFSDDIAQESCRSAF